MRIGMRLPIVGPGLITKDLIAKDIAPPCPFTTKSGDTQSLLVFRTPGILFHQIKRVFFLVKMKRRFRGPKINIQYMQSVHFVLKPYQKKYK